MSVVISQFVRNGLSPVCVSGAVPLSVAAGERLAPEAAAAAVVRPPRGRTAVRGGRRRRRR